MKHINILAHIHSISFDLYSLRLFIMGTLRWHAHGNDDESYDTILVCWLNSAQKLCKCLTT